MSTRKEVAEAIAKYLVANEQTGARKVAWEIIDLYEKGIGLRPDTGTLVTSKGFVKAERWVTNWELAEDVE